MAEFVRVADLSELAPGACATIDIGERVIALFNVGGEIFALDNTCLHRGGPLGEGELDGDIVTCPWHGWQYNVRTGEKCGEASKTVVRFDVKIEDGQILVAL